MSDRTRLEARSAPITPTKVILCTAKAPVSLSKFWPGRRPPV